jgi:peptidyl-prolyl cis-trans isomerase B (cyclophilin B)
VSSSNRRERQLARDHAASRDRRRRERERRRRRRHAVVAAGTAAVVLLGVVGFTALTVLSGADTAAPAGRTSSPGETGPADGTGPADAGADAATEPGKLPPDAERPVACGASTPAPPEPQAYDAEPPLELDPGADYVMTLRTSCGEMLVDLAEDSAPRTVNSFRFLAEHEFFDGAPFSRLTGADDGFVVLQGGDQEGTGAGGPGYTLPDEALEGAMYPRGTVALANAGPGTGGSQFFLVGEDTSALGPQYTPLGRVESGLDVLDRILAVGHDGTNPAGGGRPAQRVYIENLTVTAR